MCAKFKFSLICNHAARLENCCILGNSRKNLVKISKKSVNNLPKFETFWARWRGLRIFSDVCPLPFPFSVFPFRPGNLGLFGALLQPQEKKHFVKNQQKNQQLLTKKLRLENGGKGSIV